MQVAGNAVSQILDYFTTSLRSLYAKEEIKELAYLVLSKYTGISHRKELEEGGVRLSESELIKVYDAVKRLASGEPWQYISGESYFYKHLFRVDKNVLIPRPETEELVDYIIKDSSAVYKKVLDIGTGSGCIAISLKAEWGNDADVYACDISPSALSLAKQNAERIYAPVQFVELDILNQIPNHKNFDLIVSNPPYVLESEKSSLHANVLHHEPHLALFVAKDPILFYRRIIDLSSELLQSQGLLYFELNPLTAMEVQSYAAQCNLFSEVELMKDLSGNVRFFKARKR